MRSALAWLFLPLCTAAPAAPQGDAAKKDLERMHGRWAVVTEIIEGESTPAAILAKTFITFEGDKLVWEPKADNPAVTVKPDPTKKPPAIDLIHEGNVALGIYQLEGDTLKLCWEDFNSGRPRPTAFGATKENRYLVLKRAKQ